VLAGTLAKGQLDLDQTHLLSNLLWAQADILLKLNQSDAGLAQYENVLQLLYWQTQQTVEKNYLEIKNKISEIETLIAKLGPLDIRNIKKTTKSIYL
jgi:hypothetical protein